MKVGIVGAGIAGLAAARTLQARGVESTIFEKGPEVGGRCTTQRIGAYTFDTGATSIAARGRSLGHVMFDELDVSELIAIKLPIYVHSYGRIFAGESSMNHIERYTYLHGNETLPRLLSKDLDVRAPVAVESIERNAEGKFELAGEPFDALILTAPLPETDHLLRSLNESRPFANARYRPCLSVMLGYNQDLSGIHYHALIDPEQRHPLTWLSIESAKCPERAPDGHTAMVAQLSPEYSRVHFESSDAEILEETIGYVERLIGSRFCEPEVSGIRRWQYSQPETTALFDTVNRRGSRLLIASDGIVGGRLEYAYEAGAKAAQLLVESL